ncbi:hypothetical protein FBG13_06475 [Cobetia marina]|uniref:hypothetical protein n=1 Tax=Cobetia marina TaxID=28258 RepID=UPI0010AE8017|nr:hypothetical protein [Cobetia marina]TKD62627.1 hypothetical protein FBG13_06475 [Cobetia marina]
MSDFLFSSVPNNADVLAASIKDYDSGIQIFQGVWGSLVVTNTKYPGFDPIETEEHIAIVVGGPVLYFRDNNFISEGNSSVGTVSILEHWKSNCIRWDEDLSGPFVILIVDKVRSEIKCITDLMLFVPVYYKYNNNNIYISTQSEAVAKATNSERNFDEVSLVDFILNSVITFPHTAYKNIYQIEPATIFNLKSHLDSHKEHATMIYWKPSELNEFANIQEASKYLYEGVQGYVKRLTKNLDHIAHFISAGEDSRSVAGLLAKSELKRDAYIFLDNMNREGKIAKKVAKAYGADFKLGYRNKEHYLNILPTASDLVGPGHQYAHSHTLGFDKKFDLSSYPAVFGGYIADSLLKAEYANKPKWLKRFPFLPQFVLKKNINDKIGNSEIFSKEILREIKNRRSKHLTNIKKIRPNSYQEWFKLWPATMRSTIPNLYCNRRLFASHEIFTAKESVKLAASVPVEWKLNRRLFNQAFKPALKKSQFIFHADGRLPYYTWRVNIFIQAPIWFYRKTLAWVKSKELNEGPWGDWESVINSNSWNCTITSLQQDTNLKEINKAMDKGFSLESKFTISEKINLLQVCYHINKKSISSK